ncbi:MAG: hypothetical protein GY796_06900 [Chloroflexi bacterium]|nr:hypothetical protein [Chloroflexota bacterium]
MPNPHKAELKGVLASKFLPKKQRTNWLGPNAPLTCPSQVSRVQGMLGRASVTMASPAWDFAPEVL